MLNLQPDYETFFEVIKRHTEEEISLEDQMLIAKMLEETNLQYEVGNLVQPLVFFARNKNLTFFQNGILVKNIKELDIKKSFFAFSTEDENNPELYYHKQILS